MLAPARLIGTEVFVRGPSYRPVRLAVTPGSAVAAPEGLQQRLLDGLRRYLDPLAGGPDEQGWPFGEPLRPSELLGVAQEVAGRAAVITAVSIGLDGAPPSQDCQDVAIGPHDLVVLTGLTLVRAPSGIEPEGCHDRRLVGRRKPGRKSPNGRPCSGPPGRCLSCWTRRRRRCGPPSALASPADTPDWSNLRRDDPGVALTSPLGDLFRPVLERANRPPEKLLVEELRIAGISVRPATAARAVLQLQVVQTAPALAVVAEGFQLAAAAASGPGRVVFETERTVVVTPAQLAQAQVQVRRVTTRSDARALSACAARLRVFGDDPAPGAALWLGLDTLVRPAPSLSLGVVLADPGGLPLAADRGGTSPPPALPPPVLRWDVLDGARLVPAAVVLDDTAGSGPAAWSSWACPTAGRRAFRPVCAARCRCAGYGCSWYTAATGSRRR